MRADARLRGPELETQIHSFLLQEYGQASGYPRVAWGAALPS